MYLGFFFFKQKTAYEMRISDWSSDVCSSDLYIWYELLTSDAEAAQKLYASVLGWSFADSGQAAMDYRIINAGEHSVGGLMAITQEMEIGRASCRERVCQYV